ncbi:FkbM family methyltransferase [Chryseobacterium sp. JAH]|uniref:FkbM family methyltransferase n=1 Tax=Chryseobacterium sp. JAH TaxID=1742858 RepID=UPI000740D9EA|nr:FkbM family methyltransferase [Chryseobacterium sp. JAH]KUJ51985.1 hypothetical protein AR685_10180 [Chryseobacterium sp. JAH]
MGKLTAGLFRILFKIPFLREKYFGFHKHIFNPYQLFSGVKEQILYRKSIKIHVNLSDWIQQQLYFLGDYEKPEIDYVTEFLKPGDVFIDIGANIGLFSLNASEIVGEKGKVYAFEAFPSNYRQFKENISINKFENIIPENKAISNQNSTIEILYNEKDRNIGMASAFLKDFTSNEVVECTTLDQYSDDHNINKIALIKIDIEGSEYDALLGMTKILTEIKPQILIEINHKTLQDSGHNEVEIINLLRKFNYKIIKKLSSDEQSYNAVFGI